MIPADLRRLEAWYRSYADRFMGIDKETDRAVQMKTAHTARVRANILQIGQGIGLEANRLLLADATALLHDTGRFRQFRDHHTFVDAVSVNHARLGLREIGKEQVLAGLDTEERRQVCRTVAWHNAQSLPTDEPAPVLELIRLLRDADKVDIFGVTLDRYEGRDLENNEAVDLGLPDSPTCSPVLLAAITAGQVAPFHLIRTLNDFKIAQLSWIFDIQFTPTFHILEKRQIVPRLCAVLPKTPQVTAALRHVTTHLARMVGRGGVIDPISVWTHSKL
ncbi:MAG: HD domain-containing protein [Desulfobacterales bacterium]|nr:HD domain-containing protein [Desulfobacterales bacterium]